MNWPLHCFKAYDIRGLADKELDELFAERLGRALATYLDLKSFSVARDIRDSSPGLAKALIKGLSESGVKVLDLGILPTGGLYHSVWNLPVDGGCMVTASHLPMPTHNGFKICKGRLPLAGDGIQELKEVFLAGNFRSGEGEVISSPHDEIWIKDILDSAGKPSRKVKVVVDCGNAVTGPFMERLLVELGLDATTLYTDWQPTEPNHPADPTRPANMVDLGAKVVEVGAELGIGIDGDGDRIGVVDETGRFIHPDRLIPPLAEEILSKLDSDSEEARSIVYDVKCSMAVEAAIVKSGGIPVMARTGHSFMKAHLADNPQTMMAAEMSGHIFLADRGWYGFDDSLYNTARLLARVAELDGETFGEMLDRIVPSLPTTGEVKVPCPESDKDGVVAAVTKTLLEAGLNCSTVDGVRARFNSDSGDYIGWYLCRRSNTEEVLVMRVEAIDDNALESVMKQVVALVSPHIGLEKLQDSLD